MPDEIQLHPTGANVPRHAKRHRHSPTDGSGNELDRPTITDFTNAQHDHSDADDGGGIAVTDFTNSPHDHGDTDDGGRLRMAAIPPLPSARVYHDANQSIASGGGGAFLAFNQERWDTDSIHDNSTNNTRLTCKTAGYYSITAGGAWETNGTGSRSIGLILNGATPLAYDNRLAPSDINARFTVTTVYPLAVNDYVEVAVFQSSGGALNVLTGGNYSPEFSMHWVGPTS